MSVDRLFLFDLFDTIIEVSSAFFCSNPDVLSFDESEKGIFDSLKNIARLPLDSPKEGIGWPISLLARWGNCPLGRRARSLLPLALVSVLVAIDWFLRRAFR